MRFYILHSIREFVGLGETSRVEGLRLVACLVDPFCALVTSCHSALYVPNLLCTSPLRFYYSLDVKFMTEGNKFTIGNLKVLSQKDEEKSNGVLTILAGNKKLNEISSTVRVYTGANFLPSLISTTDLRAFVHMLY